MIFSPHHTTPPYPGRTRYLGLARIWIWYSRLSFFPYYFLFFFLFLFILQDQIGFFAFSKGKSTTHYCLPHSPELENRLTRYWQRETRLERRHGALAVLHGHVALFGVRTAMRCDAILSSSDIPISVRSTQIPNAKFHLIVSLQIGTICDLHPGSWYVQIDR